MNNQNNLSKQYLLSQLSAKLQGFINMDMPLYQSYVSKAKTKTDIMIAQSEYIEALQAMGMVPEKIKISYKGANNSIAKTTEQVNITVEIDTCQIPQIKNRIEQGFTSEPQTRQPSAAQLNATSTVYQSTILDAIVNRKLELLNSGICADYKDFIKRQWAKQTKNPYLQQTALF